MDESDSGSDSDWDEEVADSLTVDEVTSSDRTSDDQEDEIEVDIEEVVDDKHLAGMQQSLPWRLRFLPYADAIPDEAKVTFDEIKTGIANSILLRDIRGSLVHWCVELQRYINQYARHYSRADAVQLIHTLYDVMHIKALNMRIVRVLASTLTIMLKKPDTLSRAQLTLDWRPLYTLYTRVRYAKLEEEGVVLLPKDIQKHLEALITQARVYFTTESTKEILNEVHPMMCPWDVMFPRALVICNLFLPTMLTLEQHRTCGAVLWFDEMWQWYTTHVHTMSAVATVLPKLFTRLAVDACGYVDWAADDRARLVFTHLFRSLDVHVNGGKRAVIVGSESQSISIAYATKWIVYMLANGNTIIHSHLASMFSALASFYHPSNLGGQYAERLLKLLNHLAVHVCSRVRRERHSHANWVPTVPVTHRLSASDLESVVSAMLPCALQSIYTKVHTRTAPVVFVFLGQLAPQTVVPALFEQLEGALDSLTEPHRLQQLLHTIATIIYPIMREGDRASSHAGKGVRAKEAEEAVARSLRLKVIPLLNALLPALDPNDAGKSHAAFQVITLTCRLLVFVDCSEAVHLRDDLSPVERELCSQSAMLEPFVDQLLDRVLLLIEQSATGHQAAGAGHADSGDHGMSTMAHQSAMGNIDDLLMNSGMVSMVQSILMQCSTPISRLVGNRVYQFVVENEFASRSATQAVGELMSCSISTNSSFYALFMRHIIDRLSRVLDDAQLAADHVDNAVMWYLTLLSQCVRAPATHAVAFEDELTALFVRLTGMRCRTAVALVCDTIEAQLTTASNSQVRWREMRRQEFDRPLDEHLPIREWAQMCHKKSFSINWHETTSEEMGLMNKMLEALLWPCLRRVGDNPGSMDKEEMQTCLHVIYACVSGCGYRMPWLDAEIVPLTDSLVHVNHRPLVIDRPDAKAIVAPDGTNARQFVYDVLHKHTAYMLAERADDAKSTCKLVIIMQQLMANRGMSVTRYNQTRKVMHALRKSGSHVLKGSRALLMTSALETCSLAHCHRTVVTTSYHFTRTHAMIMGDLFTLSTSAYSVVRAKAQTVLGACFQRYPYVYRLIMPRLMQIITPPPVKIGVNDEPMETDVVDGEAMDTQTTSGVTHEQFKGALYTLFLGGKTALYVRQSWSHVRELWPILSVAHHSDKPTIITLLGAIANNVVSEAESFHIESTVSDVCIEQAARLYTIGVAPKSHARPVDAEMAKARTDEARRNEENKRLYYELVGDLHRISIDKTLHWRHNDMAHVLLTSMFREDMPWGDELILTSAMQLTDESERLRQCAIATLTAWLKCAKPPAAKMVYPVAADALTASRVVHPVQWGLRDDNTLTTFHEGSVPKTEDEYDHAVWFDKPHHAISLQLSAPNIEQTGRHRTYEQLRPVEQRLVDMIRSPMFVDKCTQLLTLEADAGQAHDDAVQGMVLVQRVLRNTHVLCVEPFKRIIERLADSRKLGDQRLIAEIVCGLARGVKHWRAKDARMVTDWLRERLPQLIDNITDETVVPWATCMATIAADVDPRRLAWLLQLLLGMCHSDELLKQTAAVQATRLYLLQSCMVQGEWRVLSVWKEFSANIRPLLSQSYQNVRGRLGSCLSSMLIADMRSMHVSTSLPETLRPPRLDDLLGMFDDLLPNTWAMVRSGLDRDNSAASLADMGDNAAEVSALKTLFDFTWIYWRTAYAGFTDKLLGLLPLMAYFENDMSDEQLQTKAHNQLTHGVSKIWLSHSEAGTLLSICSEMMTAPQQWWKVLVSLCSLLQVSIYCNLWTYVAHKATIASMVDRLIVHERMEVRLAANKLLHSLLQCSFLSVSEKMIAEYGAWTASTSEARRHGGVLALSAVVKSTPYSVPEHIPSVIMRLSRFANARYPLCQTTVRLTMSEFKRTHQDCWHEHRTHFTDDQLATLTDLLVSPSYYV